jgi:hypothetical protein
MSKNLVLAASAAIVFGSRMPVPGTGKDSTGTTDMVGYVSREGLLRIPNTPRTHRLRAPTTTRAYRTFSLDREVDVLSSVSMTPDGLHRPAFSFVETTLSIVLSR